MEAFLNVLEIIGCIIFVVFFLGFCVFIHEFGHFLTARLCGLHVNAFSLGFKKAWGKKINGVDYRIGWLPFGGYVDIPQIDSTEIPHTEDGKELPPAKPIHRLLSAFAGPFFNILFGLALGCVVWVIGVQQFSPKMREIVVQSIDQNGPEYKAGLRQGDKIYKVNDETFFCTWNDFVFQKTLLHVGKVKLDIKRDGKRLEIVYTPEENPNAPEKMRFEKMPWPYFTPQIPIQMFPRKGSPAAQAGMKDGDIIVSIDGIKIEDQISLGLLIAYSDGKPLNFVVNRDGKIVNLAPIIPVLLTHDGKPINLDYRIGVAFSPRSKDLTILDVTKDSPAEKSGLKTGDIVRKVNGQEIADFANFQKVVKPLKDTPFTIQVKRGDKNLEIKVAAKELKAYDIGISVMILDHPNPWQQFMNVVDMSYKSLRGLCIFFANKAGLTQKYTAIKPRNLSGPIGLATTLYTSVKDGSFRFGLYFVVVVSFALAIFNLLPLPVLDGGHMALALIEIIIRKPVHEAAVKFLTFVFIFLLIALMIYVTYFDILRKLPESWQNKLDPDAKKHPQKELVVNPENPAEKKDDKQTSDKTD
jgi:membrane-associated protease RseP (regulator of RpoE activity)